MRSTPWQLTFEPGVQMEPTWSADGRQVAYAADRSGNSDIWVQSIDGVVATRETLTDASDWQPAWSPDGRWLAFRSERDGGGIYIVPAAGGPERRITHFGYHPQWSPDGSKLLFYGDLQTGVVRFGELPTGNAKPHAVYLLTLPDGRPTPLSAELGSNFISYRVKWHPDGHRVSVWGKHRTAGWSFWTGAPLDWKPIRSEIAPEVADQLQKSDVTLADFSWSQRGNALFFEVQQGGVSNIWRIDVNSKTQRWQRAAALTTGTARHVNISVSPDGTKIAFSVRSDRTRLWSFPFDAVSGRVTGEGQVVLAEGADAPYDVSQDGRQIVYRTSRRGTPQLWKRSLPQGEARLLVSGPALSVPRFSRDGTRIVARRDNRVATESSAVQQDIVLLASSGGQPQLLTMPQRTAADDLTTFAPFDWSVDGVRILSACSVRDHIAICLLSLPSAPHAEREMRVIASAPDGNLFQAQFAPDERLICFQSVTRATGLPMKSAIHVAPATGGPWVSITDGEFWDDKPRWSPNGRMIYYASRRNGFFNIWARPFDPVHGLPVGTAFRVTDFESPSHALFHTSIAKLHISVLSDRLILPITDSSANIWMLENFDP
jgi:Tol biopolymer transport system component